MNSEDVHTSSSIIDTQSKNYTSSMTYNGDPKNISFEQNKSLNEHNSSSFQTAASSYTSSLPNQEIINLNNKISTNLSTNSRHNTMDVNNFSSFGDYRTTQNWPNNQNSNLMSTGQLSHQQTSTFMPPNYQSAIASQYAKLNCQSLHTSQFVPTNYFSSNSQPTNFSQVGPSTYQSQNIKPSHSGFGSTDNDYRTASQQKGLPQPPSVYLPPPSIQPTNIQPQFSSPSVGSPPTTNSPFVAIAVTTPPKKPENTPEILRRPLIKKNKLGFGEYGRVYQAEDEHGNQFAVKNHITDEGTSFIGPCIREIDILSRVRGHPHVSHLESVCYSHPFSTQASPVTRTACRSDSLHSIMRVSEQNLQEYICSSQYSFMATKHLLVGILLGIEYIHSRGILHRDIKPRNILYRVDRSEKSDSYIAEVCDLGMSKHYTNQGFNTPGVVTVTYRAPEIALNNYLYGFPSDMWSIGCTLYELLTREWLFKMKDDDNDVLLRCCSILPVGDPLGMSPEQIRRYYVYHSPIPNTPEAWCSKFNWSKSTIELFNKQGIGSYDQVIDLISNLLHFDPKKRLTAQGAVNHPFCKGYKVYTDHIHSKFPLTYDPYEKITLSPCREREWMSYYIKSIYNDRKIHTWYNHRILFMTIDLFNRYLHWLTFSRNQSGKINQMIDLSEARINLLVCLYLSIKFNSTLVGAISFDRLAHESLRDNKNQPLLGNVHYIQQQAEEFEKFLITEVCGQQVYRPTVYEAADKMGFTLTSKDVARLVICMCDGVILSETSPVDIVALVRKVKSDYHDKQTINLSCPKTNYIYEIFVQVENSIKS